MSPVQIQMQLGQGDIVVLELHGRLSRDGWMDNRDPIAVACGDDVFSRKVMLSLANSNYLDSTGVDWLLVSDQKFKDAGGKLVFHSASRTTCDFLKMMRMHLVLDLVPDEVTARDKLTNYRNGSQTHA